MGGGVMCENVGWVCDESLIGVVLRGCGLLLAKGRCWTCVVGACQISLSVGTGKWRQDEPQSLSPNIPHAHGSPWHFRHVPSPPIILL